MFLRSTCFPLTLSVLLWGLLATGPLAAEEALPGYRTAIFNGENLNGWQVTGCEAVVEDGLLVLKDGDGLVRTDHRYGDFILELSWRPRRAEKYDSGIYFRADLPPQGKPWPARYQANLLQGAEGNALGLPGATSKGLAKPGQWNQLRLTVIGSTAQMEINGQPAWKVDGIVPRDGYIGLQSEVAGGGQFEFKEMYVTELGYRPLFNGRDLTGWEGGGADAAQCWTVENGMIMCTGKKGPWLRSQEKFGDFNLRLDYKLMPDGNSGVYIRVPSDGRHHGAGAGIEVQVLDDKAEKYKSLKPYQYTGSLYAIVPASQHVGRPPEEWNSLEIDTRGTSYRITHNGVTIVEASEKDAAELAQRLVEGHLGLQNHSSQVWFKNLRIGPSLQSP